MIGRGFSVLLIAVSLIIQVFALTAIFDALELFDTAWRAPFALLGNYYAVGITFVSEYVSGPIAGFLEGSPLGGAVTLPCWWIHLLAMYAAASLAVWSGSIKVDRHGHRVGEGVRGVFSMAWPLAIFGILAQGFRGHAVTNFARQHSGTTLLYGAAALGLYAAANWANINVLEGPPAPGQEVSIKNIVTCPLVNTDGIPESLGDILPSSVQEILQPQ